MMSEITRINGKGNKTGATPRRGFDSDPLAGRPSSCLFLSGTKQRFLS
jgi:hypothetical protein